MQVAKSLGKLCTPALVYFWIAIIAVLLTLFQNIGGKGTKYSLGTFSCKIPSMILILRVILRVILQVILRVILRVIILSII